MGTMIAQPARLPASRGVHWCVVLAAGGSRRLGRRKQLVRYAGEALVRRAARHALATRPVGVAVVVGAGHEAVARVLCDLPVTLVRNPRWRAGLSTSVRRALAAAPRGVRAVLFTTVDQWAIGSRDLEALVAASCRGRHTVAAGYAGRRGIPALVARRDWTALRTTRGDVGAREILQRATVVVVPLPRADHDLDTPTDLAQLRRRRAPAPTWDQPGQERGSTGTRGPC